MNISDLLGAMMQSGMSASSNQRLRNAMGGQSGGGLLESLAGALGGSRQGGGGLGDVLSGMLGQGQGQGGGGLGGMLGSVLSEAGGALGGNRNLAVGGLGALAGMLLGKGGKSMGNAVGGGMMALLAAMAFQALKGSRRGSTGVPLGLVEPQSAADQQALENQAELVIRSMINAVKSDGMIDQNEIQRLTGKLSEMGADAEARNWVENKLREPMETDSLIDAARNAPEVAAQLYGASLMAIAVDTPAERNYLNQFAAGLGLPPEVTQRIEQMVGL
jgi:uncharacterized membrane protein YebE (DUF533 family)